MVTFTTLMGLVLKSDVKQLTKLLDNEPAESKRCLFSTLSRQGESVLHAALRQADSDIINLLLDQEGIDVDLYETEFGYTPLIAALSYGANVNVIRKLLSKYPQLTLRDKTEEANSVFHWAAAVDNPNALVELVHVKKELINIPNAKGETPLHVAIRKHQDDNAVILIQNGADVNCKDDDRFTPLHRAAEYNMVCTVEQILNSGRLSLVLSDCVDREGNSPLHIAYEKHFVMVANMLKKFGFDENLKNYNGVSAADLQKNVEMAKLETEKKRQQAKLNKGLKKRKEKRNEMLETEVSQFLLERNVPESVIEATYHCKIYYIEDKFLLLTEKDLIKLGMLPDDRKQLLKVLKGYNEEEAKKVELDAKYEKKIAQTDQFRKATLFISGVTFIFSIIYLLIRSGILQFLYIRFTKKRNVLSFM